MDLSLIQTSQNRKDELARFVVSLNAQEGIDLSKIQLIFIDQEDNQEVFSELSPDIDFTYIPYKHCSLSHARNIGLPYVKGKYVGFPDDDCWYEPETLMNVLLNFSKGFSGVIARSTDENGVTTNKSSKKSQFISKYDHCGAISYTIFLKYITKFFFDENIGVGSSYKLSSGEETDFLIRFIEKSGLNIWYDRNIIIHHPRSKSGNFKNIEIKQYEYARGWGYLMRKHHYPLYIICKSFVRPIGGILFSFIKNDHKGLLHSYYILKGRLEGFFYKLK